MDLGIDFIATLFEQGYAYGSLNSARCALSTILSNKEGTFGAHPEVVRVMKGIQIIRPQLSKYQSTWDVNLVFEYLRSLSPLRILTLKKLTVKTLLLMLLTSCQRVQTMHVLKISDLMYTGDDDTMIFRLSESLKHHRKGSLGFIAFSAYRLDPGLDVVRCLNEYILRTEELRGRVDRLFITTQPPYRGASQTTLARWTRATLREAGVQVVVWSAHSVRSASTSKLSKISVPVEMIMDKAQWKSAKTFQKFYQKPIIPGDVSHQMLDAFVQSRDT